MATVLFALVAILVSSQSAWAQCCESGGGNVSRDSCCSTNSDEPAKSSESSDVELSGIGVGSAKAEPGGVISSTECTLRISRPVRATFEYKLNESAKFHKWKEDYVRPVVCPVLQCHGGCAKTDLGCKGIYNSILRLSSSCCESAPPVVRSSQSVFTLREVLRP